MTENKMFCFQCQETAKGTGCTIKGVCGKEATTSKWQDLLLSVVRGIGTIQHSIGKEPTPEVTRFLTDALFTTITNANFNDQDILVVEVGVGDGGEECIREETGYLWCRLFAYAMLYGSYATNHAEQQILPLGSCCLLTANTLDGTACTLSCFLTLETEHLVFCHIAIN